MEKHMTKAGREARVVAMASGAYSEERYTPAGWLGVARKLIAAGFTNEQAEAVLRSKHMRWAADKANRSGYVTTADFMRYVAQHYGGLNTPKFADSLEELKGRTVTQPKELTGADLAGSCEGEDIAELIDFVKAHARTGNKHALAIINRIERRSR